MYYVQILTNRGTFVNYSVDYSEKKTANQELARLQKLLKRRHFTFRVNKQEPRADSNRANRSWQLR